MNKIQIGNSIALTWKIDLSSASGNNTLVKDKTELYMRNAYEVKKIENYTINDNVVCFIFDAEDQKYTGVYDLVLKDADAGTRYITRPCAFALVLHREESGNTMAKDESGNYVVELVDKVLTVKDINEDAGIYVRVAAIEAKLKEGCILTPEEAEFFRSVLLEHKGKLSTLPDDVVTGIAVATTDEKASLTLSKVTDSGSGYQQTENVVEIGSATETEAGMMSAADKRRLEQGVKTVGMSELDGLNGVEAGADGKPVMYAVVKDSRNVGTLLLFSDDMSHVTTQIFTTHCYYSNGGFLGHMDDKIYQYSRIYNISAVHGLTDRGTWSEWTPFVDEAVLQALKTYARNITELQNGKFDKASVVQELGDAENKVVSQKVVKALDAKMMKTITELQGTVFPLQVSLQLDKTLLEYTGSEQSVKASYAVTRKGVGVEPASLTLHVDGKLVSTLVQQSGSVTFGVNKEGDTQVVVDAAYGGLTKSATAKVTMVLPVYCGFGRTEADVAVVGNKLSPRLSASGMYSKTCGGDDLNFIILVPKSLPKLNSFSMGGAPFVMVTSSVSVGGKEYYMYKSGAVYISGTALNVQGN